MDKKIIVGLVRFTILILVSSLIGGAVFFFYATKRDKEEFLIKQQQAENVPQPVITGMSGLGQPLPQVASVVNMPSEKPYIIETEQQTKQYIVKEKTKAFWEMSSSAGFWGFLEKNQIVFGNPDVARPDWTRIRYNVKDQNITLYVLSTDLDPYTENSSVAQNTTDSVEVIEGASSYCQEIWPVSGAVIKGRSGGPHRIYVVADGTDVLAQFNETQTGHTKILYVARGRREEIRFENGDYGAIFITGEQVTSCNNFLHDMQIERLRENILLSSDKDQTLEFNVGRENKTFDKIQAEQ